jgi:hypothetical protein
MPAKAGSQQHVNVRLGSDAVPFSPSDDYWIVRFR